MLKTFLLKNLKIMESKIKMFGDFKHLLKFKRNIKSYPYLENYKLFKIQSWYKCTKG